MVAVRLHRLGVSVLAKSPPRPAVSRESLAVAVEEGGAQPVRLHRLGASVLAKSPPQAAVSRESLAIAVEEGGAQPVRLHRLGVSVLAKSPPRVGVGRLSAAFAVEEGGAQPVRLHRLGVSVLGKRGLPPVVPRPLTSGQFFLHNWADEVSIETSFTTDIQRSPETLAEERRSLGQRPDRIIEVSWLRESKEECYALQRLLRQLTEEEVQVPLYPDVVDIQGAVAALDTTVTADIRYRRYFQGARVLVFRHAETFIEDPIILTISSLTASSVTFTTAVGQVLAAGKYSMVPLIDCEIVLEPEVTMRTALVAEAKVTLREIKGASSLPPYVIGRPEGWQFRLDLPVFEIEPNWLNGVKTTYVRYGNESKVGRRTATQTEGSRYCQKQQWDLSPLERDEYFAVAGFFDSRRGRCLPFWAVDREFHLSIISISSTAIFVEPFGDFDDFSPIWTEDGIAAGIVMKDGTVHLARIFSVSDTGSAWRLTLEVPGSLSVNVSDIDHFAPARNTRFESDAMTEKWSTAGVCSILLSTIELQNEKDVEL